VITFSPGIASSVISVFNTRSYTWSTLQFASGVGIFCFFFFFFFFFAHKFFNCGVRANTAAVAIANWWVVFAGGMQFVGDALIPVNVIDVFDVSFRSRPHLHIAAF
jgi:hypothetical protein